MDKIPQEYHTLYNSMNIKHDRENWYTMPNNDTYIFYHAYILLVKIIYKRNMHLGLKHNNTVNIEKNTLLEFFSWYSNYHSNQNKDEVDCFRISCNLCRRLQTNDISQEQFDNNVIKLTKSYKSIKN